MKNNYFTFCKIIVFLFVVQTNYGQVGIGTTTPNGGLEIKSTQYGVVFPKASLTATNVESPVINPAALPTAVGTTVYNTNTTNTGSFDVQPGIYTWNGSVWVRQYYKSQVEVYSQSQLLRTKSNGGFVDVKGFPTDGTLKFFAKYTGLYKIEVRANYGGGAMVDNGEVNVGIFEGDFRFTFNTTPYLIHAKSFSIFNAYINGGTQYSNNSDQVYRTIYVNLVENNLYPFSLEFDQYPDPDSAPLIGFLGNGNNNANGDGRGYVGQDIPCYIEFTYIKQ